MAEFSLPDFSRVDREILREISRRHGLDAAAAPLRPGGLGGIMEAARPRGGGGRRYGQRHPA